MVVADNRLTYREYTLSGVSTDLVAATSTDATTFEILLMRSIPT